MLSIIMPVYNTRPELLKTSIDSVLNQELKDYELLIVNDGSTDIGTLQVLSETESLNNSRVVILNKTNGGVSSARNYGIANSKYEYIAFIDSDDYVSRTFYKTLLDTQLKYPNYVICSGRKEVSGFNNITVVQNEILVPILSLGGILQNINKGYLINNPINKIYIKEKINFYFDENIDMGEDLTFNLNYVSNFEALKFIKESGYYYVIYKENTTNKSLLEYSKNYELERYIVYSKAVKKALLKLNFSAEQIEIFFSEKSYFNLAVIIRNVLYKKSPYNSFNSQLKQIGEIIDYNPLRTNIIMHPTKGILKKIFRFAVQKRWRLLLYIMTRLHINL